MFTHHIDEPQLKKEISNLLKLDNDEIAVVVVVVVWDGGGNVKLLVVAVML